MTFLSKIGILWLLFCMFLGGAELDFGSEFGQTAVAGAVTCWRAHPWSGYRPLPQVGLVKTSDGHSGYISVRQVQASSGGELITDRRHPARSGDLLKISFRIRGKGRAGFQINNFTLKNDWNRPAKWNREFVLTSEWVTYMYSARVENGPYDETGFISPGFRFCKGTEADIEFLRVEHSPGKYRGDYRMPGRWKIFGPMDGAFVPGTAELTAMPETLNGVNGRWAVWDDGRLDFAPYIGGKGNRRCGWAFAQINSDIDCDYTIGTGGDWWMQVFVNGRKIADTMATGNVKDPVAMDNYVSTIRLTKGKNIIAVRLLAGDASADFFIGGPLELSLKNHNLVPSKISWIENFDSGRVSCSGHPVLIQGHPTPGLLVLTGQGVFSTTSSLVIQPPKPRLPVPEQAKHFTAQGVRVQNFGRKAPQNASLEIVTSLPGGEFAARISCVGHGSQLEISFLEKGKAISRHTVPYRILPADFTFSYHRDGQGILNISSLVDSSSRSFQCMSPLFVRSEGARGFLRFTSGEANREVAEVVLDNYFFGCTRRESKILDIPYMIEREKTFNPAEKGWKLIFADEFNGGKLDEKKWYHRYSSHPENVSVRDGKLIIQATLNEKGRTQSAVLATRRDFLFGYYEARLRFRKESGWWAAFWLYPALTPCNPYIDGLEVDIFEDYYLRAKTRGGKPGNVLDHNLHLYVGNDVLKSWNYPSVLPGPIEDFYVVGCKWTPFEISYYLNGRLISSQANHSPYDSVTFDAFYHGNCITPLKAILSGPCGMSGGSPKDGNFPDEYQIDYVRIYEYPRNDLPEVKVNASHPDRSVVKLGTTLTFDAQVRPASGSKSPVRAVYLMDSGHLLEYRTRPPYRFEVPLTEEYYKITRYVRGGRSGKTSGLDANLHAYSVFVQDADGKVAYSDPVTYLLSHDQPSRPYQGKAQKIPGEVKLSHYDEGGMHIAYFDTTPGNPLGKRSGFRTSESVDADRNTIASVASGEWLKLSVDVLQDGYYTARLKYGTPLFVPRNRVWVLIDGKFAGDFPLQTHSGDHFAVDSVSELRRLKLSAGHHCLTIVFFAGANFGSMEFMRE